MNEFILKYQGKELEMPEWGDFGNSIVFTEKMRKKIEFLEKIITCDNLTYEELAMAQETAYSYDLGLNHAHELNTKFNGLFKGCVYGNGNDIAVKVRQFDKLKIGDVFECSDGHVIIMGYDAEKGYINRFYDNADGVISLSSCLKIYDRCYKDNLLDEYFQDRSELAKMCGFE